MAGNREELCRSYERGEFGRGKRRVPAVARSLPRWVSRAYGAKYPDASTTVSSVRSAKMRNWPVPEFTPTTNASPIPACRWASYRVVGSALLWRTIAVAYLGLSKLCFEGRRIAEVPVPPFLNQHSLSETQRCLS